MPRKLSESTESSKVPKTRKASESRLDSELDSEKSSPTLSLKERFAARNAVLLQKSLEAARLSESSTKDTSPRASRAKAPPKTSPKSSRKATSQNLTQGSLFATLLETLSTLFDRLFNLASWLSSWLLSLCLWALFIWLLWREIEAQKPEWLEHIKPWLEPLLSPLNTLGF